MVVLNRIYTRTGDAGETALGSGERVSKAHLRIQAYGTVDETNATLGIVRLHTATPDMQKLDAMLARIQNELFDLGADLCVPDTGKDLGYEPLRILPEAVRAHRGRDRRSQFASSRRCAPSCCPAAIPPPLTSTCPAPSAAAPSASSSSLACMRASM